MPMSAPVLNADNPFPTRAPSGELTIPKAGSYLLSCVPVIINNSNHRLPLDQTHQAPRASERHGTDLA
eukprot:3947882-Amphidinium_carterae.2